MKPVSLIGWLLALTIICHCEAKYTIRRPMHQQPPPPPPQIYKKSWPAGPRVTMGNAIPMGANYVQNRPPMFKPPNYRVRRPTPVFNPQPPAAPVFKAPLPAHGPMHNFAVVHPERLPPKDFHSMNSVPEFTPEFSPEFRPETPRMPQTSHRGTFDDDKGPIHTIPAPNLSPADKPHDHPEIQRTKEEPARRPYANRIEYGTGFQATSPTTVTSNVRHQYEVTESNEINPIPPTFFSPDFESSRISTSVAMEQQPSEHFVSHSPSRASVVAANVDYNGQAEETQHGQLQVSASDVQVQNVPELHIGHSQHSAPPFTATQLYDTLSGFPQQQMNEQYAINHQPQLQQHLLQQQLSQLFHQPQPTQQQSQQPNDGPELIKTSYAHPTLHSFNYDEQGNRNHQPQRHGQLLIVEHPQRPQQQQQQEEEENIYIDQNYGRGKVTADYNVAPDIDQVLPLENSGPQETVPTNQQKQQTYFNNYNKQPVAARDPSLLSPYYTSLPSREAAEKLATLAAAGNINSQLIGQLKKQQEIQGQQQTQEEEEEDDERQLEQEEQLRYQQQEEQERRRKQEQEKRQRLEQERRAQQEQERRQQQEQERRQKLEQERRQQEQERRQKQEQERRAQQEQERRLQQEQERRLQREQERRVKQEQERRQQQEQERRQQREQERLRQQQLELERLEQLEQEKILQEEHIRRKQVELEKQIQEELEKHKQEYERLQQGQEHELEGPEQEPQQEHQPEHPQVVIQEQEEEKPQLQQEPIKVNAQELSRLQHQQEQIRLQQQRQQIRQQEQKQEEPERPEDNKNPQQILRLQLQRQQLRLQEQRQEEQEKPEEHKHKHHHVRLQQRPIIRQQEQKQEEPQEPKPEEQTTTLPETERPQVEPVEEDKHVQQQRQKEQTEQRQPEQVQKQRQPQRQSQQHRQTSLHYRQREQERRKQQTENRQKEQERRQQQQRQPQPSRRVPERRRPQNHSQRTQYQQQRQEVKKPAVQKQEVQQEQQTEPTMPENHKEQVKEAETTEKPEGTYDVVRQKLYRRQKIREDHRRRQEGTDVHKKQEPKEKPAFLIASPSTTEVYNRHTVREVEYENYENTPMRDEESHDDLTDFGTRLGNSGK